QAVRVHGGGMRARGERPAEPARGARRRRGGLGRARRPGGDRRGDPRARGRSGTRAAHGRARAREGAPLHLVRARRAHGAPAPAAARAAMNERVRILVVRRDNIGDLVCTTPLIAALRRARPEAFIAALVNSYNRDVLKGNTDVDRVYAYGKAKHRGRDSLLATYARRVGLVLELRRERFDYAILAAPGFQPRSLRLARLAGARHVVGFTEGRARAERAIDLAVPYGPPAARHEVEDVLRLLAPLGLPAGTPELRVVPDTALAATMRANVAARMPGGGPLVA